MPVSQFTEEEHETRAMLLGDGWWFYKFDHTYNRESPVMMLCAETMEEIKYRYAGGPSGADRTYRFDGEKMELPVTKEVSDGK